MINIFKSTLRQLFPLVPRKVQATAKHWRDQRLAYMSQGQAEEHLRHCANDITQRCLADIGSLREWEAQRSFLHDQLIWMLGLNNLLTRGDLKAQCTGCLERTSYYIKKIVFQSLPGLYVTGNLYLPSNSPGPVPCVLYLCGHKLHPTGAKTQYQERFLWYPAHGFACLALDSLVCGEVTGWHGGTQRLNQWDWLSLGYTPAGLEVWNAMRALDYLCSREEIDSNRIGVTGISGGGIISWYLSALDERIKVAAPSCSTYTIGSQAALNLVGFQCDCTFYPNVFQLDFPIVGALIAPRPLLFTNGRKDRIFPPIGFREVFRRLKPIYALYGSSERLKAVEANSAHTDPPLFLHESRRWMCQWLHPSRPQGFSDITDPAPAPVLPALLASLGNPPADAINDRVHNCFIDAAAPPHPDTLAAWKSRKAELLVNLGKTVFAWFPTWPAQIREQPVMESGGYVAQFARFSEWRIEPETGVMVRARLLQPMDQSNVSSLLVIVKGTGDTKTILDDEMLPVLRNHVVLIVYPRFSEVPVSPEQWAVIERTAALCGRTCASMQIWDLLVALRWAKEKLGHAVEYVSLYGVGDTGVVALYAAALNEEIHHVILRDPPGSHRQGPALMTVLRTTDLPEVAATLAPRHLSFIGHLPAAFDLARFIYQLHGSAPLLRTCPSLTQALAG